MLLRVTQRIALLDVRSTIDRTPVAREEDSFGSCPRSIEEPAPKPRLWRDARARPEKHWALAPSPGRRSGPGDPHLHVGDLLAQATHFVQVGGELAEHAARGVEAEVRQAAHAVTLTHLPHLVGRAVRLRTTDAQMSMPAMKSTPSDLNPFEGDGSE